MIEFSTTRKARIRDEKVEPVQLALAELMAWGWKADDAMLVLGLIKETDDKTEAKHTVVNYTSGPKFVSLYKKRLKQIKNGAVVDDLQKIHPTPGTPSSNRGRQRTDDYITDRKLWQGPVEEPASDEDILSAMWDTITKLKPEDPKRVDLLDKYDKLKRRQGIGVDDTTIHFYLPRPECDTCPFRGNRIITEPEKKPEPEPEKKQEEGAPRPGYSIHGKKLGRPPKRRHKKPVKTEE